MRINLEAALASERAFRACFPQIPAAAKSFRAFWREDKTASGSFCCMPDSGHWILKDFATGKGYDLIQSLATFRNIDFKGAIKTIGAVAPEFIIAPDKNVESWAQRRNIDKSRITVNPKNGIDFAYYDYPSGDKIGTKTRLLDQEGRFVCSPGLSTKTYFFSPEICASRRLYILGSEGDSISLYGRLEGEMFGCCVAVSGEAAKLPTQLAQMIQDFEFEEVCIIYDNPLYEPETEIKTKQLAKEVIGLPSVKIVFAANWHGRYEKDVAEVANLESLLNTLSVIEYEPINEDKELILAALAQDPPPLTIDEYLPPEIADCLKSIAKTNDANFPPFAVFNAFLPVVAGLLGVNTSVECNGVSKHAVLWSTNVFDVGVGKSPITENGVLAPLLGWEEAYHEKFFKELEQYKQDEKKSKSKELFECPKQPKHEHILLKEATIEAVYRAHKDNPAGLIYFCDELKSLYQSFGQYKGGKGNDRENWLSIGSGGQINIIRVDQTQNIYLKKSSISIVSGIQPDSIRKMLELDGEAGDGLWSRFLYYNGKGFKFSETFTQRPKVNYNVLNNLYYTLHMNRNQKRVYTFENLEVPMAVSIDYQRKINSSHGLIRGYQAKQYHKFLILAMVLQAINSTSTVIGNEVALLAKKLIEIYEQQALAVLEPPDKMLDVYQKILDLEDISCRNIMRRHLLKTKKEVERVLQQMEELGLGKLCKTPRGAIYFEKGEKT